MSKTVAFLCHFVVVKAPGMDALNIPLTRPPKTVDGVSVWEWSGPAMDEGDDAANWFSTYIGKPSRLVRFNDGMSYVVVFSSVIHKSCATGCE